MCRAATAHPVVGDKYDSPLALFALATFLAHVSGRLGRLRGLAGVSLPFELLLLPASRIAELASWWARLGPGPDLNAPDDIKRNPLTAKTVQNSRRKATR